MVMEEGVQMRWELGLLRRRNGVAPIGLKNVGNSCYLNSVLQCLTYTPPLANFCLKRLHSLSCDIATEQDRKRDCPFCILEKRIARSLTIDQILDTPAKLNSCLRIFADHFRLGRQEDAHEFLRYVIDACHNTSLRLKKLQLNQHKWRNGENGGGDEGSHGDQSVVKEIFGGSLQSQVKCLSCGMESNKVDDIMDISLDVLHTSSLNESMKKFFQAEILDGNNKYKCDRCKQLVKARKQMSLLHAPNVLVIQLKRFEGIFGGKIDKAISFDELLVLSSYMSKANQDPYPEYNLFGTIVHSGFSRDSGHYYAYVKDAMGRWYCCNDACVKLSNSKEVLSEKVYILFFIRTERRAGPTKAALVPNVVKSEKCNGKDGSLSEKVGYPVPMKAAVALNGFEAQDCNVSLGLNNPTMESSNGQYPRPATDHVFVKKTLTVPKVDELPVPFGPQPKPNGYGISSNKIASAAKISITLHKSQPNGKNGRLKPLSSLENGANTMKPINGNGVAKCEKLQSVNGESSRTYTLVNGNGDSKSHTSELGKENVSNGNGSNKVVLERGYNNYELQNGRNDYSNVPGSKRKLCAKDMCISLAEDVDSQKTLETFKNRIGIEASSVLRTCGWTEEVLQSMRAKKLCLQEAGGIALESNELKKLLISDAKRSFLSQVPASLKKTLIESIEAFIRQE